MRILVTGGAGYIGINTSLHLLKGNHEIFIVDNLSNSHLQSIKRLKKLSQKNFLFSKTDLREEKKLEKIFSKFKPDAVMHFAGLKSVEESMSTPIDYFDANVTGSIKLLNCMNKFNCKKIVFSSSATVYGHPKYLPLDENHPKSPINTYGKTKLMIEDILKDWAKSRKKACVLRYFNPIGAHHSGNLGEHPQGRPSNLIPFLTLVASGKFKCKWVDKDGNTLRDKTSYCAAQNYPNLLTDVNNCKKRTTKEACVLSTGSFNARTLRLSFRFELRHPNTSNPLLGSSAQ